MIDNRFIKSSSIFGYSAYYTSTHLKYIVHTTYNHTIIRWTVSYLKYDLLCIQHFFFEHDQS